MKKLIENIWTKDGIVFIKNSNGMITECTRENELPVTFALKNTASI